MQIDEVDLLAVRARVLSKAAFFTDDKQVLKDLITVIKSLEENVSKEFYNAEEISLEEIEQFYFRYIHNQLLIHVKERWQCLPGWQKLVFHFSYRAVVRRMSKVQFLVSAILVLNDCKDWAKISY